MSSLLIDTFTNSSLSFNFIAVSDLLYLFTIKSFILICFTIPFLVTNVKFLSSNTNELIMYSFSASGIKLLMCLPNSFHFPSNIL